MFSHRQIALLFLFFTAATQTSGSERVGNFTILDAYIRATYRSIEKTGDNFDLSDSIFALSWQKDNKLSTYFSIGNISARNVPIYYAETTGEELGFLSAYANYSGVYGRLRAGLIPLGFGHDGVVNLGERFYQRSKLFSERIVGLTDFGFSFFTENNGYYTEIIGHNGEVHTRSDGRLWVTGNWGFNDERKLNVQMSLQTGSVRKEVSTGSSNAIGGVDNDQNARWRNGAFFIHYYPQPWSFLLQIASGGVDQNTYNGDYLTHLFETSYRISRRITTGIRYEDFDPNRNIDDNRSTLASVLLMFTSDDLTSKVILLGTKVLEQDHQIPNDELRLVWVVSPFAH